MPKLSNLHTHTVFSDGSNTVDEYAEEALRLGFVSFGTSEHSYLEGDDSTMPREKEKEYVKAVREAAKRWEGKIDIFCGMELDAFSDTDTSELDYIIASVHELKHKGNYVHIDWGDDMPTWIVNNIFNGDQIEFAKVYYNEVLEHAYRCKPDIIGHYDLITKYSSIDETEEYLEVAKKYMLEISKICNRFEINTGTIIRKERNIQYPCDRLLKYLSEIGGRIVVSTDAHRISMFKGCFNEMFEKAKSLGFKSIDRLTKDGFVSDPL